MSDFEKCINNNEKECKMEIDSSYIGFSVENYKCSWPINNMTNKWILTCIRED